MQQVQHRFQLQLPDQKIPLRKRSQLERWCHSLVQFCKGGRKKSSPPYLRQPQEEQRLKWSLGSMQQAASKPEEWSLRWYSVKATLKKQYTHLISKIFSDFLRLIIYLIEKAIKETNNTVRLGTKKFPLFKIILDM